MRESRLELLSGSLPPDLWQLRRVHLSEELGRPFEAALEIVVAEEGGLADDILDELLRAPAMVRYGREGELELHGIVRAIEMDSTYEPTAATYHLRLVPRMWELSQIRRSRIFQEATVVDIVTEVLEGIGLGPSNQAVDWRVAKTYPTREYTVQYEETDLDFVQRLLEHHGIYYLFEHAPDGECVVFVDDKAALVQLQGHETIEYAATSTPDNPRVTALTRAYTPQPAAVRYRQAFLDNVEEILLSAEPPKRARRGRVAKSPLEVRGPPPRIDARSAL